MNSTYPLAALACPDKVGLASAAAHLVCLLEAGVSRPWAKRLCPWAGQGPYKTVEGDIFRVSLSTTSALDREGVPERVLLRVIGAEVRHPGGSQSAWPLHTAVDRRAPYPWSSAESTRASIVTVYVEGCRVQIYRIAGEVIASQLRMRLSCHSLLPRQMLSFANRALVG